VRSLCRVLLRSRGPSFFHGLVCCLAPHAMRWRRLPALAPAMPLWAGRRGGVPTGARTTKDHRAHEHDWTTHRRSRGESSVRPPAGRTRVRRGSSWGARGCTAARKKICVLLCLMLIRSALPCQFLRIRYSCSNPLAAPCTPDIRCSVSHAPTRSALTSNSDAPAPAPILEL